MNYLLQETGHSCVLFALCNLAIHYGLKVPTPGDAWWEELVDLGRGRYGPLLDYDAPARELGLVLTPAKTPVVGMVSVWNPEREGGALHAVAVTEQHVINLRWRRGPVIEPREAITPYLTDRGCWSVTPTPESKP